MSEDCCNEMEMARKLDGWEAGAIIPGSDGWVIVADGGAFAVVGMKFCPWCGTKLPMEEA